VALAASSAFADTTQHVKQSTLDDHQGECVGRPGTVTLWHFVITQLGDTTPASIHVIWDNGLPGGAEADVPLLKRTGGTAHYETTLNVGMLVTDATAELPDGWSGEFNLSHVGCIEPEKAEPEIRTEASSSEPGGVGSTFSDTAFLSDGSTDPVMGGTVTFKLYNLDDDADCSGTPLLTSPKEVTTGLVDGTAEVDSDGYLITTKGTYTWVATYGGDDNNGDAGPTDCGDEDETILFDAAAPDVATQIHLEPNEANVLTPFHVALGSTVHDSASVDGPDALGTPQGTVYFTFYGTIDCDGSLGDEDTPTAVAAGSHAVDASGIAHPSASKGPLGAGSYSFSAQFVSSNRNVWDNSPSQCEQLTVDKGTTGTSTEIHLGKSADETGTPTVVGGATAVNLGSIVHDEATVTGTPAAFTPTGDVTFTFYKNATNPAMPCDDATAVAAGTVSLDANGVAHPSNDSVALAAGSYGFIASYEGDKNYADSLGSCEPLTVNPAQLGITTKIHNASHADITNTIADPGSVVHDTATVTGAVAGFDIPAVTFTLNGSPANNANPAEAGFSASTVNSDPLTSGSYIYVATVAGNSNYIGATGADERLSVLGRQNGLTLGYYGNQNGQYDLTGSRTGPTLKPAITACVFGPLANGTNSVLVDGSGNYKTVAFFATYANVKSYLLGASATNMAYMLSAQLLTTEFNVCLGKVNATKSIYVPAVTLPGTNTHLSSTLQNALSTNNGASSWLQVSGVTPNPAGVAKIQTILDASIGSLKVKPNTIAAGPNRTYQEALKDLLDGINNNQAIFLP
jgi:hypothetical protein